MSRNIKNTVPAKKAAVSPPKPVPPKVNASSFADKFRSLTALPAGTPMIPKVSEVVEPVSDDHNDDLANALQNGITDALGTAMLQYTKLVEAIKKHKCIDLKAMADKDAEIARLKFSKEQAESDLHVARCSLEEALATKMSYFKKNKELMDQIDLMALRHYDKENEKNKEPSPAQAFDLLDARMGEPAVFDYVPGVAKQRLKKSNNPRPALKKPQPTKIQKTSQEEIEDLSVATMENNLKELSEDSQVFGNDELFEILIQDSQETTNKI